MDCSKLDLQSLLPAVPVACLWLSLWVWAWLLLGRCLSPPVLPLVPFRFGGVQLGKKKGHRPQNCTSIASVGHMVVCVVTVQMVGARQFLGATILEVEVVADPKKLFVIGLIVVLSHHRWSLKISAVNSEVQYRLGFVEGRPEDRSFSAGRCSGTVVLCIRRHKSASLLVVCVVTDQMVGDSLYPRAT